MKKTVIHFVLCLIILCLAPAVAQAKKKKKEPAPVPTTQQTEAQRRINNLSPEDKQLFDALSDEQKAKLMKGEIDQGFNAWMVKLALGEPFYGTEHHPIYKDYEEVWLYTKPENTEEVREETYTDPQTNWPTLHRTVRTTSCTVSDFFVLWDRGVVQVWHPATDKKVHGSCVIETHEEFLPIVDGKPTRPVTPKN